MSVLSGESTLNNPLNESAFKCFVLTLLSQAGNSFRFTFNSPPDGVKPIVVKIDNRPAERFLAYADSQLIAADFAQLLRGNAAFSQDRHHLFGVIRRDGNHNASLRFVEENFCSRVAKIKIDIHVQDTGPIKSTFGKSN